MHARSAVFVTVLTLGLAGCVTDPEPPPATAAGAGADARGPQLCEAYQLDGLDPSPGPRPVERRAPDGPDAPGPIDWTTETGCHLAAFSGHSGRTLVCPIGGTSLAPLAGEIPPEGMDPPTGESVAASEGVDYQLVEVDGRLWLYAIDPVTGERLDRVCLVRDA